MGITDPETFLEVPGGSREFRGGLHSPRIPSLSLTFVLGVYEGWGDGSGGATTEDRIERDPDTGPKGRGTRRVMEDPRLRVGGLNGRSRWALSRNVRGVFTFTLKQISLSGVFPTAGRGETGRYFHMGVSRFERRPPYLQSINLFTPRHQWWC